MPCAEAADDECKSAPCIALLLPGRMRERDSEARGCAFEFEFEPDVESGVSNSENTWGCLCLRCLLLLCMLVSISMLCCWRGLHASNVWPAGRATFLALPRVLLEVVVALCRPEPCSTELALNLQELLAKGNTHACNILTHATGIEADSSSAQSNATTAGAPHHAGVAAFAKGGRTPWRLFVAVPQKTPCTHGHHQHRTHHAPDYGCKGRLSR